MAEFNITIVYTGAVIDDTVRPVINEIPRIFVEAPSYVDTAALEGTIYDTNVEGWGSLPGLDPYGDGTYKLAWLGQAVLAKAKADAEGGENAGVTFTVAGADEQLYWNVMKNALANQGFDITVANAE